MTTHREPDPEGDAADAAPSLEALGQTCSACGGPLDEDGDCEDPTCWKSPEYSLDDDDDWDDEDDEEVDA